MNREIKFRAWDKRENKMMGPYQLGSELCEIWGGDDETMQYTGLKDKNGVEIYEGDVVKGKGGAKPWNAAIGFEHGCFIMESPWTKKGGHPELKYYIDMTFVDVEVVGNIYENPELLGVK